MSIKKIVSLILALTIILTAFSGAIITKAVDVQSDKAKLLNAIAATNQTDRINIVDSITNSDLSLKTESFDTTNIQATAQYIQGKLGGDNSILVSTVKSGLAQFYTFYNANPALGKFLFTQLKGTLTDVTTPSKLGALGTQIEEYAGSYKLFVNTLLYLKKYITVAPLEEDANGKITQSAAVAALRTLYYSIGFDNDRLTAYEVKLSSLLANTNVWPNAEEKKALRDDLVAQGVLAQYVAPVTPGGGGSSVTPTPTPTPVPTQEPLNVKPAEVTPDGIASAPIPADKLNAAFDGAQTAPDGTKTVTIIIEKADGADAYAPVLPASALSSGKNNIIINIETPAGNIAVPGNMLNSSDVGTSTSVKLVIGTADASVVKDEAVKSQIGNRPVIELKAEINGAVKEWNNPDAPVTISVNYKPTAEELKNPDCITVYYIDGAGKAVSVPNAKYNASKGMVTFTTTHFSEYAVAYVTKSFTDLAKYSWAKPAIDALAAKGVLEGVTADKFSPQTIITRDEFLAGIVRALGLTATTDGNFADVKTTNKYYKEIAIAKALKVTSGTGNNNFGTGTTITRQDMMTLVVRAMMVKKTLLKETGSTSDIAKFTDKAKVSSYAVAGVATCVKEGIIIGSNNSLNPKGNLTKAEAAVVLLRMMKK